MTKPLRKIIGYTPNKDFPVLLDEVLECGHAMRPITDMYGVETEATRRRCRKCNEGAPKDIDLRTGERL